MLLTGLGVLGAIAYLNSRDDATVSTSEGPGEVRRAGEGPVTVKPGNVVLLYADRELAAPLRALQRELAGPPSEQLSAAGQAVVVQRLPDVAAPIVALSARHRLQASRPDAAQLREFVEYWLGRESR